MRFTALQSADDIICLTQQIGFLPFFKNGMLVCARLRHVAGTQWGNKKYMNMKHLETLEEAAAIAC